jgi:F0F1-type ATP synthase membrane subunit a
MASATHFAFEFGRIMVIPFWFFEVFVALIQAIVFTFLMIAYFKGAAEHGHHE